MSCSPPGVLPAFPALGHSRSGSDHEIFTNECDEEGKNEFPEGCIDKPGVNRHILHGEIAARALKFFGDSLRGRWVRGGRRRAIQVFVGIILRSASGQNPREASVGAKARKQVISTANHANHANLPPPWTSLGAIRVVA